jgi:diguanylate cyclase (GGDEF)-like protein
MDPDGRFHAAGAAESWSTQQLAEFSALISSLDDEETATVRGVERIAEVLEAEVAALLRGDKLLASVGFPAGREPAEELAALPEGEEGSLEVTGIGECWAVSLPLGTDDPLRVVVASPGERLDRGETDLLRGMGRVLSLGLRSLDLLNTERTLRERSESQATENARLLEALRRRQILLERLSRLQRAIVDRLPVHEILQAAVEGACEFVGADVAALRRRDEDEPSHTTLVASVGASATELAAHRREPVDAGLGGRAMRERQLVVSDAVSGPPASDLGADFGAGGVSTAMAAPIYEGGQVAGSLAAGSQDSARDFSARDQQVLSAFAEHASLALDHARAVEEAVHEAFHDSLTGMPNRALFRDRLEQALTRAERTGGSIGVLVCDLDGFQTFNDSLGPEVGDRLLCAVGERLSACLRPSDTVARLGGDEFAVLLESMREPEDAARAARRILDGLSSPFELAGREVYVSASIGMTAAGTGTADTLLRDADLAMYRAKEQGRGRYTMYEPEMHTAIVERLELEVDLKRAIENGELLLAYQPIYNLSSQSISGLEALVRWRHPTRGLVRPDRFVPLAEETGQIIALGRWVLRTAAQQAALWRARYPGYPGLQVSVNISGAQLAEDGLREEVSEALDLAQLDPGGLVLEITETVLMEDIDSAVARLAELKDLGVDLSIDDFGSGYSSLTSLRRFPLDQLKIERHFVGGIGSDDEEPALLRAIIDLAEIFDLIPVAEGIERRDQGERLLELGCEFGQGNLLSEPLSATDADALLLKAGLLQGEGVTDVTADETGTEGSTPDATLSEEAPE